jgi:hypothetical protein
MGRVDATFATDGQSDTRGRALIVVPCQCGRASGVVDALGK